MSTDHPAHPSADQLRPADRRALLAGIGGLAAGALLAGSRSAHAGPLDPPVGPITPTGLTLDELAARTSRPSGIAEPRRPFPAAGLGSTITESGSYYLTSDFTGNIFIEAEDVTLDLCGFTLRGGFSDSSAIVINLPTQRVLIRNGRIDAVLIVRGITADVPGLQLTVEDLVLVGFSSSSQYVGVRSLQGVTTCRRVSVAGFQIGFQTAQSTLDDCQAIDCFQAVVATASVAMRRFFARRPSGGFATLVNLPVGSSVIDSRFVNNDNTESRTLSVGSGSLVDRCVISGGAPGILSGDNTAVLRTVVTGTGGVGIDLGAFCRVSDCSVSGTRFVNAAAPGIGVRASQRLRLERSTIASNAAQGVRCTSFDAAISDCSILVNSGVGIECVGPAMIDRCHLANNNGGMFFDALTRVSQCHLDFNGPYGIWATSSTVGGTFINDCDITRHVNGVDIRTATGSGVFRSRFAGNTTNIIAPAGNFQLIVFGPAAANAATNPNINVAL